MIPFKTVFYVFFILAVIIFAAFFVGFNLDTTAPVSLIFFRYESVPVLTIVLGAFLSGFLFSTFIFLIGITGRFFRQRKSIKEKKKQENLLRKHEEISPKVNGLPHYDP